MTEKELHRLKRHDLLQLLLAQGREAAQLQAQIDDMTAEREDLQDANYRFIERLNDKDVQIGKLKERLNEKDVRVDKFKERLNEKDAQIEKLKERLNEKDVQIERLKGRLDQKDARIDELGEEIEEYRSGRIFEMDENHSIADVGQKLQGIFLSAQRAVDDYLEEVKRKADFPSQGSPEEENPGEGIENANALKAGDAEKEAGIEK